MFFIVFSPHCFRSSCRSFFHSPSDCSSRDVLFFFIRFHVEPSLLPLIYSHTSSTQSLRSRGLESWDGEGRPEKSGGFKRGHWRNVRVLDVAVIDLLNIRLHFNHYALSELCSTLKPP